MPGGAPGSGSSPGASLERLERGALDAVAAAIGVRCERDVALGARTTYRVGGRAALFFEVTGVDDLHRLASVLSCTGLPVLVLGRGSNLLVADAGFEGLVISLAAEPFGTVRTLDDHRAVAGGAVALPILARQTAAAGLTGLEWAVGVPGSVGGAVRMNAGGHGAQTAATLTGCRVLDLAAGQVEHWSLEELGLGYRRSRIEDHHVVVDAEYQLASGKRAESEATIRDILRWRREHQPGGQNAGSVFINPVDEQPPGNSAGWLVEAAGLKGLRHRSAVVSAKHANFIQADPGGSANDVLGLMLKVQKLVSERLGVVLKAEVRLRGFPQALISTLGSDAGAMP